MRRVFLLVAAAMVMAACSGQVSTAGRLAPRGSYVVCRVYDGDTFTILLSNGLRYNIRVNGIDAPERRQEYGMYAREYLVQLIGGQMVTVVPLTVDRYGRTVARCLTADGKDVSLEMLKAGMAWHYGEYDQTEAYIEAERDARYEGLGIWGNGNAVNPQTYRSMNRTEKRKYQ